MEKIYYLDNAATTKMFDEVLEVSSTFLAEDFYNPSAVYSLSVNVKRKIETAREFLLDALGAVNGNLVFTGSATEANNMVIFSERNFKGKKLLFGAGEHPSVLMCAKELEKKGYDVCFVPLDSTGRVDEEEYKKLLSPDVQFVSIQHVSNETGAINNIQRLCALAKKANPSVRFHSDGVQAFMKINVDVENLGVDFYTISAHKIGGSKGVGALYIKKGSKVNSLIFGGGQENGLRSGTENVFGIMSFYEAAKKMQADFKKNREKLLAMRQELLKAFEEEGISYVLHGEGVPGIMSIVLDKTIRGETLVHALERRGVYISTGSACSATKSFNHTLEAMGINKNEILSSVRISLSPYIEFNAKEIAEIVKEEINKLKGR